MKKNPPKNITSGEISFGNEKVVNYQTNKKPFIDNYWLMIINKILRYFRLKSIIWK